MRITQRRVHNDPASGRPRAVGPLWCSGQHFEETPRAASSRTSSIPGGGSSTKVHLKWCGAAPLRLHGSFELEKALRARHVRAGRAELPLCDSPSHRQHKKQQAMKAAPTRAADIRRRQRAVWIRPHILRGPAGQSPMRLSHHASQEVLKPGLCFSANQCPGTWRRRRVRACTDPHTGSASPQICMGPLPMRRSQWPSHIGPHARLVLVCASARFSACTA